MTETSSEDSAPRAGAAEESQGDGHTMRHYAFSPAEGVRKAEAPHDHVQASADADSEDVVLAADPPAEPTPTRSDDAKPDFFDGIDQRLKTWWKGRSARREEKRRQREEAHAAQAAPETVQGPAPSAPARHAGLPWEQHDDATQVIPAYRPTEHEGEQHDAPDAEPVDSRGAGPAQARPGEANVPTTLPPAPGEFTTRPSPPPRVRRALDEQRQRTVIAQKAAAIEAATSSYQQPARYEFADDEEDLYTYIPPYNLPSRDPDPEPERWDLYRRIAVSLGALSAIFSTLWMFGVFTPASSGILGGQLRQTWLDGDFALLSPERSWYWIWPVITVGLIAHAIFQWQASQESTPRQRHSGWLVAGAGVLMVPLTLSIHYQWLTIAALLSLAIVPPLLESVRQFNQHTSRSLSERRLTDDAVGAFFGFALVQAASAVSVRLTSWGWDIPGVSPSLWAIIGLFICVWTAAFYSMTERGRITIALALSWGMMWLVFPRVLGEATSAWVAVGAAISAFIVILATQSRRHRINHAERRAAMGRPLEDII
ncbi:hypothetical protein [Nesterenkonia sp. NBAIMH1]|uniref:hypothetical protein n=1 Tax=Nesterenkonia sp. NBAIMH1 TaxID=2600320 RepID=UPI0011B4C568|nr:hypothetical protein [Nesterenkonia sp. NBAIMH1]